MLEPMTRVVIVCYRPKVGRRNALRALVMEHVPFLRARGLVSERAPVIMEAEDGTIVEVFEWASLEAIESAHGDPAVAALWKRFEAACEYVPASAVPEMGRLFSEFTPLGISAADAGEAS